MKDTVSSAQVPGEPRYTRLYQQTLKLRCRCCGEFLCSMDHLHLEDPPLAEALQLCQHCQFTLSVQLLSLTGQGRRAA